MSAASNSTGPNTRGKILALTLLLFLLAGGIACAILAFCPDPLTLRLLLLLLAATCFALPVWTAFVMTRRKLTTGHFFPTPEERRAQLAKSIAGEASPRYRRLMTILWSFLTLFWLGLSAFWLRAAIAHPEKRSWAAYWILLSLLNVFWTVRMLRKPPSATLPSRPPLDTPR